MAHCVTRVSVQEHWHASRERNHGPHVQPPFLSLRNARGSVRVLVAVGAKAANFWGTQDAEKVALM